RLLRHGRANVDLSRAQARSEDIGRRGGADGIRSPIAKNGSLEAGAHAASAGGSRLWRARPLFRQLNSRALALHEIFGNPRTSPPRFNSLRTACIFDSIGSTSRVRDQCGESNGSNRQRQSEVLVGIK